MNQDYLPSKTFVKRVSILFLVAATIFIIIEITPSIRNKIASDKISNQKLLVKDLVAQDSNYNGIPDWEEVLWGLDPKGDGASNKEFIDAKKAELKTDGGADTSTGSSDANSSTDQMSQQLLALIVSLQQSGNLSDAAIANIGDSVGAQVTATALPDAYTKAMLTVVTTNKASIQLYYDSFKSLALKYQDKNIGDELTFINQAVAHKDAGALKSAEVVGVAYHDFGQELIKIPVPTSIADTDLTIANDYEKNAQSIAAMSTLIDNPISGMSTLVQYKQYNDALAKDLATLQSFFISNGIIKAN